MYRDNNTVGTSSTFPVKQGGPSAEVGGTDEGGSRGIRKTQTAGGVGEPAPEGPLKESGTCQVFQAARSWDFLQ